MSSTTNNPATALEGLKLDGGWTVIQLLVPPDGATGGTESIGYVVRHEDGREAFLKAFNLAHALAGGDRIAKLEKVARAFRVERDLLRRCRDRGLTRIAHAISDGEIMVPGPYAFPAVPYLLFDLAAKDLRGTLEQVPAADASWRLRCLHHVATGLFQLHRNDIAHLDTKPSNVLIYKSGEARLADLGRAVDRNSPQVHDAFLIAGDPAYAPIEQAYEYTSPSWDVRRIGTDCYLLGSLCLFLFSRLSMTAAIRNWLPADLDPYVWRGTYDVALPYVREAFGSAMDVFAREMSATHPRLAVKVAELVAGLCDPRPDRRGLPGKRACAVGPLTLERVVSCLNALARRAELGVA